jgi:hypothetical protein
MKPLCFGLVLVALLSVVTGWETMCLNDQGMFVYPQLTKAFSFYLLLQDSVTVRSITDNKDRDALAVQDKFVLQQVHFQPIGL